MTPTLSVAIMAHPKREHHIPNLLERLDRPAEVVWDSGDNNRWNTGYRSMKAYDPDCTHHLVVQDDAVIPLDLVAGVERALQYIPSDAVMCLYIGKTRKFWRKVMVTGVKIPMEPAWVIMRQIHWGVGVVFPTHLIDTMLDWCDTQCHVENYDKRMGRWCEFNGVDVWYPWPSLVDHLEEPSLVPGRSHKNRVAQWYLGSNEAVTDQEWNRPHIKLPPFKYRPGQERTRQKPKPHKPRRVYPRGA